MRSDSTASTLSQRVAIFKSDPEKLQIATQFVDEIIQQAKKQAEIKLREKDRISFDRLGSQAGEIKRRLGTRTRVFIGRMFDALCNCTQTAAAAARTATAAAAARTATAAAAARSATAAAAARNAASIRRRQV